MSTRIEDAHKVYDIGSKLPICYYDPVTGLTAYPDDFSIGIWYSTDTWEEEAHRLSVPTFSIDVLGIRLHNLPVNWRIAPG